MPPSRRSRRSNTVPQPQAQAPSEFKKGDIVEFHLNGSTVTGRIVKRSPRPSSPSEPQLWIVSPSDRRRKNEKISELELRKVDEEDTSGSSKRKGSSQGSNGSDDNNVKAKPSYSSTGSDSPGSNKKRKSDDISDNASGVSGKKVSFRDQKKKKTKAPSNVARVGTRSTRNSGHELFDGSQQPPQLRKKSATKKIKSNENVTVVQMLTGTLYLYRGETRRAEFVRSKY